MWILMLIGKNSYKRLQLGYEIQNVRVKGQQMKSRFQGLPMDKLCGNLTNQFNLFMLVLGTSFVNMVNMACLVCILKEQPEPG